MDGLTDQCETAIGKLLRLTPVVGWGPYLEHQLKPPFRARLVRLFSHDGVRRGGVARVEEPDHPYDGRWVIFSTRLKKPYDFTTQLGSYMVSVGDSEPDDHDDGWPDGPSFHFAEYIDPIALV